MRGCRGGDAFDFAGAAVVVGGDGVALAEWTPADAVDELDLFVEGELLDDEVRAVVWREGGVGPGEGGRGFVPRWLGDGGGGKRAGQGGCEAKTEHGLSSFTG